MKQMLADVCRETRKVGLEIHPDKTKILHNIEHRRDRAKANTVQIEGLAIEILPYNGSQKYLGRKYTFHNPTENEIENRITTAWRKFGLLKQELTGK
eukprot:1987154-Karenia_brevis.AAC.1